MLAALRGCRGSEPERLSRYLRLFTFTAYDRFDLNIHSACMFFWVRRGGDPFPIRERLTH